MGYCIECKHWGKDPRDARNDNSRECDILSWCCFCCRDKETSSALAGAIGGGTFMSLPEFGCVQWERK